METLKKYSNPTAVLRLTRKYVKQHPPRETTQHASTQPKGILIGKTGANTALYTSTRKNKKYALYVPNHKTVHFGAIPYEDYTKHRNKSRRKNYLQRATNIKGNWKSDPYSANNLAIHLLW